MAADLPRIEDAQGRSPSIDPADSEMPNLASVSALYRRPMPSTRTGPIFNAFSYPTKIDAEAIALFIACHTRPGDHVLDVFGGSGSTGIAARLCERPTARMQALALEFGVQPQWGRRDATVYELSPLGALLGDVMANPPSPVDFEAAARDLVRQATDEVGWMYSATDPDGRPGHIRYTIWTEVLATPCCDGEISLWDAAVSFDPVKIDSTFKCPGCTSRVSVDACLRVEVAAEDPHTGKPKVERARRPASVYGQSATGTWARPVSQSDLDLIDEIREMPLPASAPTQEIFWGDLYRSGYHTGMKRYYDFYTRRNLAAVAALWRRAESVPGRLGDALRLLVLSYNASHSTLLSRVVVKRNQRDFVITGAQSGVLYVSGLPVEKNVLTGVGRKIGTFKEAFELTHGLRGSVRVVNGSSTHLDLETDSVDYLFTDPPFGDFIPYAELNQINEAWLGTLTTREEEAIVSGAQGKAVSEYEQLIGRVTSEAGRVLKGEGLATLVFHASRADVWQAVGAAIAAAGLRIVRTSVLDKVQVSFKQVVHEGGTKGDALFLLAPVAQLAEKHPGAPSDLAATLDDLEAAASGDPAELDPKRLYSRYVAQCLSRGHRVDVSAPAFYALVGERRRSASQGDHDA